MMSPKNQNQTTSHTYPRPIRRLHKFILPMIFLGICIHVFAILPVWSQLSGPYDSIQQSKQIAALEDQVRLAYVRNDSAAFDKALMDLGSAAPDSGIYKLYAQMKDQRAKKAKPSPYKALRPNNTATTPTLTAQDTSRSSDFPPHSISEAAALPAEPAAAPPVEPATIAQTQEQAPSVQETPNRAPASQTLPVTIADQTMVSSPIAQQQLSAGSAAASPADTANTPPPSSSPGGAIAQADPAVDSPAATPQSPEPQVQSSQSIPPTASQTILPAPSQEFPEDDVAEMPAYMKYLKTKNVWFGAAGAVIILIVLSLAMAMRGRRSPAAEVSDNPVAAPLENTDSPDSEANSPEMHLSDIIVNLQKNPDSPEQSATADTLEDVDDIIQAAEKNPAPSAQETYFGSVEDTKTINPELEDIIKIQQDPFATMDTVFDSASTKSGPPDLDIISIDPAGDSPQEEKLSGKDDMRLDWTIIEQSEPKPLTDSQRQTIFNEAFQKGCSAFEKQDYNGAFQHFSVAMSLRPDDPDVSARLAMVRNALRK